MKKITQMPLNDADFDRLGGFLKEIGAPAMSLEMLDGFFAALICSPDTVLPSEYLLLVFGESHAFDSNDQATEILGLVMRHWHTIASQLFCTLETDDVYFPVLLQDEEDGVAHGNDWAHGFMRGIQLRPERWQELIGCDELGGPMLPIMILNHEHDPDPALRPPSIVPEKRDDLLQSMIVGLTHIYRYFEPHRRSTTQLPLRRQEPKIGRNEPCPCGSGRKYKHCCAVNAPTFH